MEGTKVTFKYWVIAVLAVCVIGTGCSGKKKLLNQKDMRIAELEARLDGMEEDLQSEQARANKLNSELERALADYQRKEKLWLEQKESESIITLPDAVLFPSGSREISKEGQDIIGRIAGVVSKYTDRDILIEGHTDNVPIGRVIKEKYPSNWELSTHRACAVLQVLRWKHNINAAGLAAVGYGEFRPIAENTTPEGRAKNRRVVIVIAAKS
jgi:chemotaxis protein MotB